MDLSAAEMPSHAKFATSRMADAPLVKLILANESEVVADCEAGRITVVEFEAFRQNASESLAHPYGRNDRNRDALDS